MNVIEVVEPLAITVMSRRKQRRRGLDGRNAHLGSPTDSSFAAALSGGIGGPRARLLDIACDRGRDPEGNLRQPTIIAHVEAVGSPAQRRLLLTGTADVTLAWLQSGAFGYHVQPSTAATLRRGGRPGDFVWLRGGLIVPCATTATTTHHLDPVKIAALVDLRRPHDRRRLPPVDVSRVAADAPGKIGLT